MKLKSVDKSALARGMVRGAGLGLILVGLLLVLAAVVDYPPKDRIVDRANEFASYALTQPWCAVPLAVVMAILALGGAIGWYAECQPPRIKRTVDYLWREILGPGLLGAAILFGFAMAGFLLRWLVSFSHQIGLFVTNTLPHVLIWVGLGLASLIVGRKVLGLTDDGGRNDGQQ